MQIFFDTGAKFHEFPLRCGITEESLIYLAIIEWGWVGYEEFWKSRRVLSAEVDNTLQDLQNFSYAAIAEFNNALICRFSQG